MGYEESSVIAIRLRRLTCRRCAELNITLPTSIQRALARLNQAGYEAYIVGGCVRDSLMGKVLADWDITTSALPTEILHVFSDFHTIATGLQHGTVTVIIDGTPLEITTYRVDGRYADGRHPDSVTFTAQLDEDLKRRDFTINAMVYHPDVGLIDPFDGQGDLQAKTIRCVGEPIQRFTEDALRILRALRFSAVLGFDIEATTANAIHCLATTLSRVSIERITSEFKRLICGENADTVLEKFEDVIAVFLPEICDGGTTFKLAHLSALPRTRIAALFYSASISAESATTLLRRLRFDAQTIQDVRRLLSFSPNSIHTADAYLLRLLNHMGAELVFDYFSITGATDATIRRTRELLDERACYNTSMLAINGDDVLSIGVPAGPAIGEMLNRALYAVLDQQCPNEKAALMKYIEETKKPVQ